MDLEQPARAPAGARRARSAVGVAAALATVAAVGWLVRVDESGTAGQLAGLDAPESPAIEAPPPDDTPAAEGPVAREPTGTLLVLFDGHAFTTVDVDRSSVGLVGLEPRGGGEPIITGRGEVVAFSGADGHTYAIHAAALEAPWRLGASIHQVPSVEPDRLWLVTARPGGERRVREVAVDGRTTVTERAVPSGTVEAAVTGGLVLADHVAQTLRVWDPHARETTLERDGRFVAADGSRLAWCAETCARLVVRDLATGEDIAVDAPDGAARGRGGAFAPAGELLVVHTVAGDEEGRLAVVDLRDGGARLLEHPPLAMPPAWGPHGRWLFAVTRDGGVLVHDAEADRTDLLAVDLPTRSFGGMVAVPAEAGALGGFGGAPAPQGPRLEDGLVLSADDEGVVRAVVEGTGETAWTHDLDFGAALGPRAGDLVLAAAHAGGVVALELATGAQRWRFDLEATESPAAPAIADGVVYLPADFPAEGDLTAPRVHALDLATGRRLWSSELEAGTDLQWHPPVVADELVVVADTLSHPGAAPTSWLHALDRASGAEVWRFDLGDDRQGFHDQAPLVAGDTMVVASPSGQLFGVDLGTGQQRWRRTAADLPELVGITGHRVLVVLDGLEHRLDAATGRRLADSP